MQTSKFASTHQPPFCTLAKNVKSRCNNRRYRIRAIACSAYTPKTYVGGFAGCRSNSLKQNGWGACRTLGLGELRFYSMLNPRKLNHDSTTITTDFTWRSPCRRGSLLADDATQVIYIIGVQKSRAIFGHPSQEDCPRKTRKKAKSFSLSRFFRVFRGQKNRHLVVGYVTPSLHARYGLHNRPGQRDRFDQTTFCRRELVGDWLRCRGFLGGYHREELLGG